MCNTPAAEQYGYASGVDANRALTGFSHIFPMLFVIFPIPDPMIREATVARLRHVYPVDMKILL